MNKKMVKIISLIAALVMVFGFFGALIFYFV